MQEYNNTDQHIHLLSQVIAKVNRTYVPAKEDDSHTNLYFDPIGKKVLGRWFTPVEARFIFALNLAHFQFELIDDKLTTVRTVSISGKTIQELEAEIEVEFKDLGFDTSGLTKKLHYEIPAYEFVTSRMKPLNSKHLTEWASCRSLANTACNDLLGLSQIEGEIRIWPHHFDTGIYFEPNAQVGIGFGLAMEDEMIGAPYFYFSGYPKTGEISYKDLPASEYWEWHAGEHWKGCTLSLTTLEGCSEVERKNILFDYLSNVYLWLVNV